MLLTVLDPRTGARVTLFAPLRQRVSGRARRWVLQELDRLKPGEPAARQREPQPRTGEIRTA
jgi:hypothetical protein